MKKTIRLIAIALIILSFSVTCSLSFATESVPLSICFIVDDVSILNCSTGESPFDKVLSTLSKNNCFVSTFFNSNVTYNQDYASALMKSASYGLRFGIYTDSIETIQEALMYQKYVVKTTSRLIIGLEDMSLNDYYYIWDVDTYISGSEEIQNINKLQNEKKKIAITITSENVDDICGLLNNLNDRGLYILTPSECGEIIGGGSTNEW